MVGRFVEYYRGARAGTALETSISSELVMGINVMGSDLGSAQGVSEHGLIGDGLSGRIERNNLHLLEPLAFLRGRFQFFLRRNLRAAAL